MTILQNLEFWIDMKLFGAVAIAEAHSWKIYQSRPSLVCETPNGYCSMI